MSYSNLKQIEALKKDKRKALSKDDFKEAAIICNSLGECLHKAFRIEDAIQEHEEERHYSESLGDRIGVAVANRKLGECYTDLYEYTKALRHQKLHLKIAEEENSCLEQQRAYATIGRTHFTQAIDEANPGEKRQLLKRAETAYLYSLEKAEGLRGDHREIIAEDEYWQMKTRSLLNIGLVFQEYGDSRARNDARKYIQQSLAISKKYKLWEDVQRAALSLADVTLTPDLDQAMTFASTSLDAAVKLKDKVLQRDALEMKAKVCLNEQNFTLAKRLYKKAYKLTSAKLNPDAYSASKKSLLTAARIERVTVELSGSTGGSGASRLALLEKCADLLTDLDVPAVAIHFYKQQLSESLQLGVGGPAIAPIYMSLAAAYFATKNYHQAAECYTQELLNLGDNYRQCWKACQNLAECEESKGADADVLIDIYKKAVDMAQRAGSNISQLASLSDLASVQQKKGDTSGEKETRERITALQESMDSQEEEEDSQPPTDDDDGDSDISVSAISDTDVSDNEEEFDRGAGPRNKHTKGFWEKKRNDRGETPLHVACIRGKLGPVQLLVERQGHPLNIRDNAGWLPLHEACNHGHEDIVLYLLAHGADKQIDAAGDQGVTPLIDACSAGNLHIVRLLLEKGADPHRRDGQGKNALENLREYRHRSRSEFTVNELNEIRHIERKVLAAMGREVKEDAEEEEEDTHERTLVESMEEEEEDTQEDSEVMPSFRRRPRTRTVNPVQEEEDSEEVRVNPYHNDNHDSDEQTAGTHLYRQVMKTIRSSTVTPSSEDTVPSHGALPRDDVPSRPGLISAEEAMDNWMEDDMGTATKQRGKRKRAQMDGYLYGNQVQQGDNRKKPKSSRLSLSSRRISEESQTQSRAVVEEDEENVAPNVSQPEVTNVRNEIDRLFESDEDSGLDIVDVERSTGRKPVKMCKQLKVTDFTREIEPDRNDWIQSSSVYASQAGSTIVDNIHVPPMIANAGGIRRIRVKIKDKTIMVPMVSASGPVSSPTIGWLATEAAQRYYKLCNLRPHLALATKDGALLADDDLVSALLQNDEEVDAIVENWDLQPLSTRYTQACKDMNTGVKASVISSLCDGPVSLSHLSLRQQEFLPLGRALHCHTTVTQLHLQGNRLRDDGLRCLPLSSLTSLSVLNLSCNGLTHTAVNILAENLKTADPLKSLTTLDLSHNNLSLVSAPMFCDLIERLPCVSRLSMSSCCLQGSALFHGQHRNRLRAAMKGIEHMDLSHNPLHVSGCELAVLCLSPSTLLSLDLSATVTTPNNNLLPNHLHSYIAQAGCVLEKIHLDNCYLTSVNIPQLASLLGVSSSLKHLSLNCNPRLTTADIIALLDAAYRNPNSRLTTFSCVGCSITSPAADTGFHDALTSKVQNHNVPLQEVQFSGSTDEIEGGGGKGVDKLDLGCLKDIWGKKWGDKGVVNMKNGVITLSVV